MKHTVEEMAEAVERIGANMLRAAEHVADRRAASLVEEGDALCAAARALREMSEALTEVAQLASAESPIGRIARRTLTEGGEG